MCLPPFASPGSAPLGFHRAGGRFTGARANSPRSQVRFFFPRLGDLSLCMLVVCYPAYHSAKFFYQQDPSAGDRMLVIAFTSLFVYNTVWSWSRPLADLLVGWLNNRAILAKQSEEAPMMLEQDEAERMLSGGGAKKGAPRPPKPRLISRATVMAHHSLLIST